MGACGPNFLILSRCDQDSDVFKPDDLATVKFQTLTIVGLDTVRATDKNSVMGKIDLLCFRK
jgi:hypothetical protein